MIRVLALNINSPSEARAHAQAQALVMADFDVLVLTEVKDTPGGRRLVESLTAENYILSGWPGDHFEGFSTLVASRASMCIVPPAGAGRLQMVTLDTVQGPLTLIGAYGPSSDPFGRSPQDKVDAKRVWLGNLVTRMHGLCREGLPAVLVGDLNIVDSRDLSQYRSLYSFERDAYQDLLTGGLTDLLEGEDEFTWVSHQGQGFRFDHALATAAAVPLVLKASFEHRWRLGEPRLTDHSGIVLKIDTSFLARDSVSAKTQAALF